MPGPSLGGSSQTGGKPVANAAGTLNVKALPKVSEIQPGDLIIAEIPDGTHTLDFKDLSIGKKNITFANELTALRGDADINLALSRRLSGAILDGTEILYVKGLSSLNALTGHSGIRLGDSGIFQNIDGFYTFNVPVSTTNTFLASCGNSDEWCNAYTIVFGSSAKWWSTHTSLSANSANWQTTHTTTSINSGDWENTYTQVWSKSATWGGGSSKWTDGGDVTYLTHTGDRLAVGHSAGGEKLSVYGSASASQKIYSGDSNSDWWHGTYLTVGANSATWNKAGSVWSTVNSESADWNYVATNSGVSGFKIISTDGWGDVIAARNDTLTLSAMGNLEIHNHPGTDSIIISGGPGGGGGGGGSGSVTTIKANGSQVGDADIVTLDFSSKFSISETPNTEINIDLAPGMISGLSEVTSTDSDYILIWDATDSTLKKVDAGEFRGGGTARTDFEIMMVSQIFS